MCQNQMVSQLLRKETSSENCPHVKFCVKAVEGEMFPILKSSLKHRSGLTVPQQGDTLDESSVSEAELYSTVFVGIC